MWAAKNYQLLKCNSSLSWQLSWWVHWTPGVSLRLGGDFDPWALLLQTIKCKSPSRERNRDPPSDPTLDQRSLCEMRPVLGTGNAFRFISSRPLCLFTLQQSSKQLLLIIYYPYWLRCSISTEHKDGPCPKNLIWMWLLKLFFFFFFYLKVNI